MRELLKVNVSNKIVLHLGFHAKEAKNLKTILTEIKINKSF